jgi:hypothetical protein
MIGMSGERKMGENYRKGLVIWEDNIDSLAKYN